MRLERGLIHWNGLTVRVAVGGRRDEIINASGSRDVKNDSFVSCPRPSPRLLLGLPVNPTPYIYYGPWISV
jgi:hypothetical protein